MTKRPFELDWMGGVAEHHFRRVRPGVDELPWDSLSPAAFPPALVDRSRISWTEAAWNEYCTAAAFARLLGALLEAGAPLDLVGMASDFVADEVHHVELTSRLAMALGGGAPKEVDLESLVLAVDASRGPLERASEQVVQLCCVAEAFSVPMLAGCLAGAGHPLVRAVLERIVRDETPHGRFGWLYLEWAAPLFDGAQRAWLAEVAMTTLEHFSVEWIGAESAHGTCARLGFRMADVRALGWMEPLAYAERARRVVREEIVAPLARFGIAVDPARLASAFAPTVG